MKFKSIACPEPSEGFRITDKKGVVPNMAMSLQEILERFTRGEPLEIGKEASYDDGDDDLEKVSHGDLVDRAEFVDKLKATSKAYEKQEKEKAKAEKERLDNLAVEKLYAEKLAAEKAAEIARKEAK